MKSVPANSLDMSSRRIRWIIILYLFTVFFFATPYDLFYTVRENPTVEDRIEVTEKGDMGRRVALPLLGVLALLCLIKRGNPIRVNGALGLTLIFFFYWAILSLAWADDTLLTARKLAVFTLLGLGALAVAKVFSVRDVLVLAFFSTALTLLLSISVEMLLGTFTPFALDYQFAGVVHPNGQGANCAVFFLVSLALASGTGRMKPFFFTAALIAGIGLLLTRSRTASGSAVLAALAYYTLTSSKRRYALWFGLTGAAVVISYLLFYEGFVSAVKPIVLMGRIDTDALTLTKRIPLWTDCLNYIFKSPFLGYGYDAFWTPRHLAEFARLEGWAVPHSHSGYLEMILGLGLVGGALYLLVLALSIKRSVSYYRATGNRDYAFVFGLLIWLCCNQLLEPFHFKPFVQPFVCTVLIARLGFVKESKFCGLPSEQPKAKPRASMGVNVKTHGKA